MKNRVVTGALLAVVMFTACEKDNYDAPDATLYGSIVYNGEAVGLKNAEVTFRVYEPGWELSASTYMDVFVAQDGTYSASLFSGKTYQLIRTANIGPWVNPAVSDTLTVTVHGDTKQDIAVTPYFTIPSSSIQVLGGVASAVFSVNRVVEGVTLDKIGLYVASNKIVDATNNLAAVEVAGADIANPESITLSVPLTESMKKEGYVFARVGVKSGWSDHLLYSQTIRVEVN